MLRMRKPDGIIVEIESKDLQKFLQKGWKQLDYPPSKTQKGRTKMKDKDGKIHIVSVSDVEMYKNMGWKELYPIRKLTEFLNKTYPSILDEYSQNEYSVNFDELDLESRENIVELVESEQDILGLQKYISLGKESFEIFEKRWKKEHKEEKEEEYAPKSTLREFYDDYITSPDTIDDYFHKLTYNVKMSPKQVINKFKRIFPKEWKINYKGNSDVGLGDEYEIICHKGTSVFMLYVGEKSIFIVPVYNGTISENMEEILKLEEILDYVKADSRFTFSFDNSIKTHSLNLKIIGYGWEVLYDAVSKGLPICSEKESPYLITTQYAGQKYKDRVVIRCGWKETTPIEGATGTILGLTPKQLDLLSRYRRKPWLILKIGREYPGDEKAEEIAKGG